MDTATVRLEVLRLVHRHDHTPEQVLERAKVLEGWVADTSPRPRAGKARALTGT